MYIFRLLIVTSTRPTMLSRTQVQFGGDMDMLNGRIDATTARNQLVHAGTAMVLPVRSFAINSGT